MEKRIPEEAIRNKMRKIRSDPSYERKLEASHVAELEETWNEAIEAAVEAAQGPVNHFAVTRSQMYWKGRSDAATDIQKLKRVSGTKQPPGLEKV